MTITTDWCRWKYLTTSLPAGADPSKLVCLYQFDGAARGLLDRSGKGHDLSVINPAGSPAYFTPSEESLGVAGCEFRTNFYMAAPAGLYPATTGAYTVEFIWTYLIPTDQTDFVIAIGGPTESEEDNFTVDILVRSSGYGGQIHFVQEYDNGTNVTVYTSRVPCQNGPQHVAVTRAADRRTIRLYFNGELVETVVFAAAGTGGNGPNVQILVGGSSSGNDLYSYLNSLRCVGEQYSDDQIMASYLACRDASCGLFLIDVDRTNSIERIVPIAKDVIKVEFQDPVAITDSLMRPESYVISLLEGRYATMVDQVLPIVKGQNAATTEVYLKLHPRVKFQSDYLLRIPSVPLDFPEPTLFEEDITTTMLRSPDGTILGEMSSDWTHHRTKVDSVVDNVAPSYNTALGSNLRSILQAITVSDEEIGGGPALEPLELGSNVVYPLPATPISEEGFDVPSPRVLWNSASVVDVELPFAALGVSTYYRLQDGQIYPFPGGLQCDLTASGIGGLDTGSEAPNTWYHLYLVLDGSILKPIFSTNDPGTGPVGYAYFLPILIVFNDNNGDIAPFDIDGAWIRFRNLRDMPLLISYQGWSPTVTTWIATDLTNPATWIYDGAKVLTPTNFPGFDTSVIDTVDLAGVLDEDSGNAIWYIRGGTATPTEDPHEQAGVGLYTNGNDFASAAGADSQHGSRVVAVPDGKVYHWFDDASTSIDASLRVFAFRHKYRV